MFGVDPTGNHEEHAEAQRGNTGKTRGNHETDKESITQVLDHREQGVTHEPQSTMVRIQRSRSSPRGGLESTRGSSHEGGLESAWGIFSEEVLNSEEKYPSG